MRDPMEILLLVTNPDAGDSLRSLGMACTRAGIDWGAFFTNDGVTLLRDREIAEAMQGAASAIACMESWERYMTDADCPLELGSQTDNSALMGRARRIVSL